MQKFHPFAFPLFLSPDDAGSGAVMNDPATKSSPAGETSVPKPDRERSRGLLPDVLAGRGTRRQIFARSKTGSDAWRKDRPGRENSAEFLSTERPGGQEPEKAGDSGYGGVQRRWRLLGALFCVLPPGLVFAALLLSGSLDLLPALAAFALLAGTGLYLVHLHVRRIDALTAYARALALTGEPPLLAPADDDPLLGDLPSALRRCGRNMQSRMEELRAISLANEAVLDCLPYPLVMVSRDLTLVGANPAACELFGQGIVGRHIGLLSRHPALLEKAEKAVREREGVSVEITLPVPVPMTYLVRFEPLSGPPILRMVAIASFHDITALRRSETMRGDFIANASHELRTPLASLIGFIETLRGPAREDERAREQFLEIMHHQSQRMARLVDDLMSLSRIEMSEHTPPTGSVDLARLVTSVMASLDPQASGRQMTFEPCLPPGLPEVVGDNEDLAQLVQNLLVNAIKYGRPGTGISVSLDLDHSGDMARPGGQGGKKAAGFLRFSVRDCGEGIPREHIPRLTERFYRIDKARSHEMGSTGLGLAIVKHILNRHRGRLEITSDVGKGSCFSVLLPVA